MKKLIGVLFLVVGILGLGCLGGKSADNFSNIAYPNKELAENNVIHNESKMAYPIPTPTIEIRILQNGTHTYEFKIRSLESSNGDIAKQISPDLIEIEFVDGSELKEWNLDNSSNFIVRIIQDWLPNSDYLLIGSKNGGTANPTYYDAINARTGQIFRGELASWYIYGQHIYVNPKKPIISGSDGRDFNASLHIWDVENNLDYSIATDIINVREQAWSPDGSKLLFSGIYKNVPQEEQEYTFLLENIYQNPKSLPFRGECFHWKEDGSGIYFLSLNNESETRVLNLYDFDSKNVQTITQIETKNCEYEVE